MSSGLAVAIAETNVTSDGSRRRLAKDRSTPDQLLGSRNGVAKRIRQDEAQSILIDIEEPRLHNDDTVNEMALEIFRGIVTEAKWIKQVDVELIKDVSMSILLCRSVYSKLLKATLNLDINDKESVMNHSRLTKTYNTLHTTNLSSLYQLGLGARSRFAGVPLYSELKKKDELISIFGTGELD